MSRAGVLAVQGDFYLHGQALERAGCDVVEVRSRADLDAVRGLIIPGGESTTVARLLRWFEMDTRIRERVAEGTLAVFGTCTGMILLAREIEGRGPQPLGIMDYAVRRNAYGRQVDSFEANIELRNGSPEPKPLKAVFIRAPQVTQVGPGVEVLAEEGGRPILLRQERCLAASFHPELTEDTRVHRMFLDLIPE